MARPTKTLEIVNPENLDPDFGDAFLLPLSWSKTECYDAVWSKFACPRKYKFRYCEKLEQEWAAPLAIGTIAHETLEWAMLNDVVDEVEISGKYVEKVKELDPDNNLSDDEINSGRNDVIATIQRLRSVVDNKTLLDCEWGFKYILGSGLFRGYIDLLFIDNDENGEFIHVLDFKTSSMDKKTGKPKIKTKNHGQMALYSAAVKCKFPDKRVKASLYWLKSDDPAYSIDTYEFSDKELESFKEKMLKTIADIRDDTVFRVTKAPFICNYCSFAVPDICKYGSFAKKKARPRKK